MRILFLITKSTDGGAQTHVSQLARALIKRGDTVAVMAASGGWLEQEITALGGTFFPNRQFRNSYNIFLWFSVRRTISAAVAAFKPDIVSCHSGFAGLMGRLTIHNRIPTIFTAHGWSFSPGSPLHQQILTLLSESVAGSLCSKIICVSEYDAKLAQRWHVVSPEKLVVVKNGAEIPPPPAAWKTQLRKIACIGRLAPQKKPIELLEALTLLPPAVRADISVSFIGDGPDRPELEAYCREHSLEGSVRFEGSVKRENVLAELDRIDVMVLPSRKEGLPRSVIEAFARGVPVIASAVGGIPELVIEGQNGYLMPADNAAPILARHIAFLHEHPDVLSSMSSAAYEYVREQFSLDRMIRETIAVYDSVLSSGQKR